MRRRLLTFMVALAIVPAPAWAQDVGPGLTEEPPIDLPADEQEEPTPEEPGTAEEPEELANTGYDATLIGLAGVGLLLVGAGIRLRRTDG